MIKWLLVFYLLPVNGGYIDKEHTVPIFVSGPYGEEKICLEHQSQQPPTKPENGKIKVYQCIIEFPQKSKIEEL